jgi:hypothetical protein
MCRFDNKGRGFHRNAFCKWHWRAHAIDSVARDIYGLSRRYALKVKPRTNIEQLQIRYSFSQVRPTFGLLPFGMCSKKAHRIRGEGEFAERTILHAELEAPAGISYRLS